MPNLAVATVPHCLPWYEALVHVYISCLVPMALLLADFQSRAGQSRKLLT